VNGYGTSLLGATVLLAVLLGVLGFAVLRFMAASRATRRSLRESGETALMSSALHDALSTLKAQERAMSARAAASEQLSEQVFDSLTAGLLVVDAEGRVKIVNPAACRMLGVPAGASGSDFKQLLADVAPLVDIVAEGLAAGRPIVRRAVHVRRENRSWHFGVTVSPLGDPAAKQGAICLFSDLTTIVELEQQLQLKEALARLGELTAGIAHEFRNGLATIHGYSRLIDPQALPAKYQPYVEGIRAETNALGQVVTKFLEFARPQPAAFWPVELEPVIRRAADELRRELPADTSVNVSGAFGVVHGDELLLRQLFGNLIRNAAEACEAAGRTPMIGIAAQADTSGDMTIIAVEDNGPGIAEADRARIFQPFFTTRSRGSGLGLSIVQKIVLHHNGRVSVDSAATGGARIQLTLPRAS
jgi:PAS domain S-box-containing protein